ncbi:unnamed protein product [Staurois parvus]|uniref:Uncharacterized protein n=1 Tax=Staurois parvus TaxID=386267 RepID=A0ABN9GAG8_9NEOB|nr:unnamed protein product [Staurois parvus]
MGGHTAPYDKNGNQQEVRRPESGTWQSVAMETAAMEGVRDPLETLDLAQKEGRYRGQWQIRGPAAHQWRPYRDP